MNLKIIPVIQNVNWNSESMDLPWFLNKNIYERETQIDFIEKTMLKGQKWENVIQAAKSIEVNQINRDSIGVTISMGDIPNTQEYIDNFNFEKLLDMNYLITYDNKKEDRGDNWKSWFIVTQKIDYDTNSVYLELVLDVFFTYQRALKIDSEDYTFEVVQGHFDRLLKIDNTQKKSFNERQLTNNNRQLIGEKMYVWSKSTNRIDEVKEVSVDFPNDAPIKTIKLTKNISGLIAGVGKLYKVYKAMNRSYFQLTQVDVNNPNIEIGETWEINVPAGFEGEAFFNGTIDDDNKFMYIQYNSDINGADLRIQKFDISDESIKPVLVEAKTWGISFTGIAANGIGLINGKLYDTRSEIPTIGTTTRRTDELELEGFDRIERLDNSTLPNGGNISSIQGIEIGGNIGWVAYNNDSNLIQKYDFENQVTIGSAIETYGNKFAISRGEPQTNTPQLSQISVVNTSNTSIEVSIDFRKNDVDTYEEEYIKIIDGEEKTLIEGLNTYLFEDLDPNTKYDFEAKISWEDQGDPLIPAGIRRKTLNDVETKPNIIYVNDLSFSNFNSLTQNNNPASYENKEQILSNIFYDEQTWGDRINYEALNGKSWIVLLLQSETDNGGNEVDFTNIERKQNIKDGQTNIPWPYQLIIAPLNNNIVINDENSEELYNWDGLQLYKNLNEISGINTILKHVFIIEANMLAGFNPSDSNFNGIEEDNEKYKINIGDKLSSIWKGEFISEILETELGGNNVAFKFNNFSYKDLQKFNINEILYTQKEYGNLSHLNKKDINLETNLWSYPNTYHKVIKEGNNSTEIKIPLNYFENNFSNYNINNEITLDSSTPEITYKISGGRFDSEQKIYEDGSFDFGNFYSLPVITNEYKEHEFRNREGIKAARLSRLANVGVGAAGGAVLGKGNPIGIGVGAAAGIFSAGLAKYNEEAKFNDMKKINNISGDLGSLAKRLL